MDLIEETNELLYDIELGEFPFGRVALAAICQHCAHWDRNKELGVCEKAEDWAETGFMYGETPPHDEDIFATTDGEGYSSTLWTGPRFGCVHWRADE